MSLHLQDPRISQVELSLPPAFTQDSCEAVGDMFLRTVRLLTTDYTVLYCKRKNSSWMPLWGPQIVQKSLIWEHQNVVLVSFSLKSRLRGTFHRRRLDVGGPCFIRNVRVKYQILEVVERQPDFWGLYTHLPRACALYITRTAVVSIPCSMSARVSILRWSSETCNVSVGFAPVGRRPHVLRKDCIHWRNMLH
jgi:hypothetical protein